jgi:hypothetical protein
LNKLVKGGLQVKEIVIDNKNMKDKLEFIDNRLDTVKNKIEMSKYYIIRFC